MTLKEKFQEWHDEPTNETVAENIIDLEKIADEFAIGFAEWMAKEYWLNSSKYTQGQTHEELLEIYKNTLE